MVKERKVSRAQSLADVDEGIDEPKVKRIPYSPVREASVPKPDKMKSIIGGVYIPPSEKPKPKPTRAEPELVHVHSQPSLKAPLDQSLVQEQSLYYEETSANPAQNQNQLSSHNKAHPIKGPNLSSQNSSPNLSNKTVAYSFSGATIEPSPVPPSTHPHPSESILESSSQPHRTALTELEAQIQAQRLQEAQIQAQAQREQAEAENHLKKMPILKKPQSISSKLPFLSPSERERERVESECGRKGLFESVSSIREREREWGERDSQEGEYERIRGGWAQRIKRDREGGREDREESRIDREGREGSRVERGSKEKRKEQWRGQGSGGRKNLGRSILDDGEDNEDEEQEEQPYDNSDPTILSLFVQLISKIIGGIVMALKQGLLILNGQTVQKNSRNVQNGQGNGGNDTLVVIMGIAIIVLLIMVLNK